MEEINQLGLEVFGDLNKFNIWFESENQTLNDKKPIDLIKEVGGRELVVGLLTRLKYGIFI
ncbi:MAG TPA: MbcA/ParS/Xre antitoxin family protein [Sediminibacterium sp.]|jgi:uncharacterized protein (DUF2384 family)|uniref:MbcA/ParS/Xre antitoxin family protein n=1 Tax=Sediminibacterium sp. TaxID=1917865 RepID=UPI0008C7A4AE|nr:MbcA/ParS/Xre antitoxin family protein [Sediminibacterium sp.]MDO8997171.1 MbcA/ParS/Xre antitoxin family protein [Sediminibacterium sp.]OHC84512.1 MAG: hypothetical protein A2472_11145 [Sphingobacteriia bacterium RIFOXYC2_FULL_35_18]OHC89025.1 MAG: hypothetical protein A2546_09015 [Sphingobacteriia bacterium RIFOXYD2_FULL_35_12]HLD53110.1 MbcA/ParS/Xre antitoxin family protein [Sediminibacterium sp.]